MNRGGMHAHKGLYESAVIQRVKHRLRKDGINWREIVKKAISGELTEDHVVQIMEEADASRDEDGDVEMGGV